MANNCRVDRPHHGVSNNASLVLQRLNQKGLLQGDHLLMYEWLLIQPDETRGILFQAIDIFSRALPNLGPRSGLELAYKLGRHLYQNS